MPALIPEETGYLKDGFAFTAGALRHAIPTAKSPLDKRFREILMIEPDRSNVILVLNQNPAQ